MRSQSLALSRLLTLLVFPLRRLLESFGKVKFAASLTEAVTHFRENNPMLNGQAAAIAAEVSRVTKHRVPVLLGFRFRWFWPVVSQPFPRSQIISARVFRSQDATELDSRADGSLHTTNIMPDADEEEDRDDDGQGHANAHDGFDGLALDLADEEPLSEIDVGDDDGVAEDGGLGGKAGDAFSGGDSGLAPAAGDSSSSFSASSSSSSAAAASPSKKAKSSSKSKGKAAKEKKSDPPANDSDDVEMTPAKNSSSSSSAKASSSSSLAAGRSARVRRRPADLDLFDTSGRAHKRARLEDFAPLPRPYSPPVASPSSSVSKPKSNVRGALCIVPALEIPALCCTECRRIAREQLWQRALRAAAASDSTTCSLCSMATAALAIRTATAAPSSPLFLRLHRRRRR